MSIFSFLTSSKKTKFSSKINKIIEVVEYADRKKIMVGGAEQTGGTITGMWEKTFSVVSCQLSVVRNCLVLGLGGGDVIRTLKKCYPTAKITCVEIDPEMIAIAKKYFLLPESLKIINTDTFLWMRKKHVLKFDLVVVDLYIGKLNPKQGQSVSFLNQLKKILTRKGVVIYNRHYFSEKDSDYQSFLHRCRKVFINITEIVQYKYCRILQFEAD